MKTILMETNIAIATTALHIESGQDSLERIQSNTQISDVSEKRYNFSTFEAKCHFTLNQLYKGWKTNEWGKSPICIPAAMEVHEKWFIRTLDPNALDYNERVVNNRLGKLRGDNAERIVHQAFQRSNIGGILIQGVDYGILWDVLKKSCDISSALKEQLKPGHNGGIDMFEIDFLFLHPIGGIFIMECKAFEDSKNLLLKECKDAVKQAQRASERLLSVFRILIGAEFPLDLLHVVLCLPNVNKKENVIGLDQKNILDGQDLKDSSRFNALWQTLIVKFSKNSINYFENKFVNRLLALALGFRSAKFISLASNSLEIFRKITSQESSGSKNAQFDLGDKILFLNSEQLMAYNIAKNGQNMLLFGPPGSGKTLLIQLLAKEASEKEAKGRVIVFLAYEELSLIYENFFKANRENQKREIIINPSRAELRRSLASDSFDDIFADEVIYGDWIPKEHPSNRQIIVGITTGRRYEKSRISFAREKLEKRLTSANFYFFGLKSVMRNTGNICKYYSKFEEESNNEIIMGHNIEGSNVIKITANGVEKAYIAIAKRIKEYLGKEDEGSSIRNSRNYYCSLADIAVLVNHEPVSTQIHQIKKILQEIGIATGSIAEQLEARATNQPPIVAVDCSTNALSLEWSTVFVINATQYAFSNNLTSPLVSYSRAVNSLIVITIRECQEPHSFFKFCKILFVQFLLASFKTQDLYQYSDLFGDINFDQSRRFVFQAIYWINWALTFIGVPLTLLLNVLNFWFCPKDPSHIFTNAFFLTILTILGLLFFISAAISFKGYRKCTTILINLISIFLIVGMFEYLYDSNESVSTFIATLLLIFFLICIIGCFFRISYLADNGTGKFFEKFKHTNFHTYLLCNQVCLLSPCLLLATILTALTSNQNNTLHPFSFIFPTPIQFQLFKLSYCPKQLKSISIQPL